MNKSYIINQEHVEVVYYDVIQNEEFKLIYKYKWDSELKLIQGFSVVITFRGFSSNAFDIVFNSLDTAIEFYSKSLIPKNIEFLKSIAYKKFSDVYELSINECEKRGATLCPSMKSLTIYNINDFIKLIFDSFKD